MYILYIILCFTVLANQEPILQIPDQNVQWISWWELHVLFTKHNATALDKMLKDPVIFIPLLPPWCHFYPFAAIYWEKPVIPFRLLTKRKKNQLFARRKLEGNK